MPSKRKAESPDAAGDGPAGRRTESPAVHKLASEPIDLTTNYREDIEPTTRHRFASADMSWGPEADHLITNRTTLTTETDGSSEEEVDKSSELGVQQLLKVEAKKDSKKMVSASESSMPKAKHVLQTCNGCNRVPKACIFYAKAFSTEKDIANGAPRGPFIDLNACLSSRANSEIIPAAQRSTCGPLPSCTR